MSPVWLIPFSLLPLLVPSNAPVQEPQPVQNVDERVLFFMESRGVASWMPDPRDAGLRAALMWIDDRLAELPAELEGGPDIPPGMLDVLARLATQPTSLRVVELAPGAGPMPMRMELVVQLANEADATSLGGQVQGLLEMVGFMPSAAEQAAGVTQLDGPMPAWISVRDDSVVLALGAPAGAVVAGLAPVGPAVGMSLEITRTLELIRDFSGDPDLQPLIEFLGEGARFDSATKFEGGVQRVDTTLAVPTLNLSAGPLATSLIDAMPAEATWAFASSISPRSILDALREAAGEEDENPFAELEEMLGVELGRDLLAHLGAGWATYASDATGGGGMMSIVALWEVSDRAQLAVSLERIAASLTAMGKSEANGYVRVDEIALLEGVTAWTARFPGIPIPVQPTLALTDGHLVFALHPAGARAALGFVRDAGGLTAVPAVAALLREDANGRAAVWYIDAVSALRDGYGYTLPIMQMIENALGSPSDSTREVPEIMPSLAELRRNAQPWSGQFRLQDGVLTMESRGDASAIARMAAQFGLLPAFYQMMGGPLMAPMMMMMGRSEPMFIESDFDHIPEEPYDYESAENELMAIVDALQHFAVNNGEYPDTLEVLVTPDSEGASYLWSGREGLIDPWGRPYHYVGPQEENDAVRVYTLGSDGEVGGVGDAADVELVVPEGY